MSASPPPQKNVNLDIGGKRGQLRWPEQDKRLPGASKCGLGFQRSDGNPSNAPPGPRECWVHSRPDGLCVARQLLSLATRPTVGDGGF